MKQYVDDNKHLLQRMVDTSLRIALDFFVAREEEERTDQSPSNLPEYLLEFFLSSLCILLLVLHVTPAFATVHIMQCER